MRRLLILGSLVAIALAGIPSVGVSAAAKDASGIVTDVSSTSLTIESTSRGTKTSKTFTIDATTDVVARGATRATKGQGRASITSMVAKGDHVSVAYDETGGTMHAARVQVTQKAPKK